MPVNPRSPLPSFIDQVIPLAVERDMGIVAMKVYFRGMAARIAQETRLFYAMHFRNL